jgi:DNA-directed RNA polymerase specialized sigma24 family protein
MRGEYRDRIREAIKHSGEADWTNATDPGLIHALRHLARSYRGQSAHQADDLVELTLSTAIEEVDHRPKEVTIFEWLSGIMARHHH